MANHPSALKRNRQSIKRKARNKARKTEIHQLVKTLSTASKGDAQKLLPTLQSKVAKAARKGTMHWKTAARKTSRLSKAVAAK
jgi:small subunit ribosomal protein S20